MSPALSGSSAIRRFKHSNAIEICNRMTFDFYTGLPHVYVVSHPESVATFTCFVGIIVLEQQLRHTIVTLAIEVFHYSFSYLVRIDHASMASEIV